MTIWIIHAHCHDRHRICGTGVRRLLRGFRPPGHLRRQGRGQDRQPAPRRDPDFRAWARCAGGRQCESRPAGFHHRTRRAGRRGRRGVHRGRHAVAARRRPCRPDLRSYRRARDRGSPFRLYGGGDEIDGAGRHRRRGRAPDSRDQSLRRGRSRLQSGISARGRRDSRLQVSRPHRGRHLGRARTKGARRYLPTIVATRRP